MHTLRYVSMARYRSSCSGRAKSGTASATAIILSSGVRASFVATTAKNPSTSFPTRTIAPCDAAAMDVERRAPSSSPLSADIDRRCLPARPGLLRSPRRCRLPQREFLEYGHHGVHVVQRPARARRRRRYQEVAHVGVFQLRRHPPRELFL